MYDIISRSVISSSLYVMEFKLIRNGPFGIYYYMHVRIAARLRTFVRSYISEMIAY